MSWGDGAVKPWWQSTAWRVADLRDDAERAERRALASKRRAVRWKAFAKRLWREVAQLQQQLAAAEAELAERGDS